MPELVRGEVPRLTFWERALGVAAALLAAVSLGFAGVYAYLGIFDEAQFPYAANSVAKDALLAGLSLLVVWDVRRWASVAVPLIVLAHSLMPLMLALTLNGQDSGIDHTWVVGDVDATTFRWTWFGFDVAIVATFVFLHFQAQRSRYGLRYLPPPAFRALMALAEVLVLRLDREVTPAEVGVRVDRYLASFRAHDKYQVRLAFLALAYLPLATLHPPFHVMSADRRQRWIERRFLGETRDWLMPAWLRDIRRAMIRAAQQFCFFGYYGDERAAEKAGYLPFSKRPGAAALERQARRPAYPLTCMRPAELAGDALRADVVVVGSGAGGSILAHQLAGGGRRVLMLERGKHVEPSEFTEDEGVQLSQLYADGALTLSKDFRFQVAQGMCVGGSTVVNNAVCFDLPDSVRDGWLGPELDAGLDPGRLGAAFDEVRRFLRVTPIGPAERRNPGAEKLAAAIQSRSSRDGGRRLEVVDCNIAGCLGSGYCNIGCKFGKKLSALDWTLPITQYLHGDRLQILPECHVEKVLVRGGRATGVRARLDDGRRLTVHAGTVVLSAGAIASSIILQRSGLGDGRAGRGLSFNIASPVTLDFDRDLHSERGVQISHYLKPEDPRLTGVTLESWFNPIVTQSLFMPGWFEEHWRNMRRYRNMTCLGVVAGTESNGTVKGTWTRTGVKLDYAPTDADFVKLKNGVRLACEVGLEARALRAMPATFRALEIHSSRDLGRIDTEIGDSRDLSINTSHPQGGNPISKDPRKGVVDPSFRVYGTENVYVCDASVFPSSVAVNPQLTVMALAVYAAGEITGKPPAPAQDSPSISHAGASGPGS